MPSPHPTPGRGARRGCPRRLLLALLGPLVLLAAGCVVTDDTVDPFSPPRRTEPGTIVIRNDTGRSLARVTISAPDTGGAANEQRIGQVAPVLARSEQLIGRPANAPPLPEEIMVEWRDVQGSEFSARLSLDEIISVDQAPESALVIVIRGPGTVRVLLEPRGRRR